MSFPAVLERGDDMLNQYPRRSKLWDYASRATCLFLIISSKLILNVCYAPKVTGLDKLDLALERSQSENRSLLTVMNHMSVVDDPFTWGLLPMKYYWQMDEIRWCLGAENVCFKNKFLSYFFSLGKVLPTERFGRGPFQDSVDAAIRLLSPDDTLDLEYTPPTPVKIRSFLSYFSGKNDTEASPLITRISKLQESSYKPPVLRVKPSWVHVFPEGFVCQLQPPHSNSMRFFRWGVSRMVLEATRPPIVVPIFTTGFEKVAPESAAGTVFERYLPQNFGAEINVTIGDPIDDKIIYKFREEWRKLCDKYYDPMNPSDLSDNLKFGKEAKELRSKLALVIRESVQFIRDEVRHFDKEDKRFSNVKFWENYTSSEGKSDPDIKFIGQNWAIKRLQHNLKKYDERGNRISDDKDI